MNKACAIFSACAVFLTGAVMVFGQGFSGKVSGGFQAPAARDDSGRRSVLKGEGGRPLTNNIFEITAPKLTSYKADDSPDMLIEAPICTWDNNRHVASSDSDLFVKTFDGRFSIKGVGWLWDSSSSLLNISNNVSALVSKSSLPGGEKAAATNQVAITSKSFSHAADVATFQGHVIVLDQEDKLATDKLLVSFESAGEVRKIEAIENVHLQQADTEISSGRAVFDVKDNIIQILEHPKWKAGFRQGESDSLVLNRSNNTFFAEGHVSMRLPLTNVASLDASVTNAPAPTNFLTVSSDQFLFQNAATNRAAHAFYSGSVRAQYQGTDIRCDLMNVYFDAGNQVVRVVCERDVEILNGPNKAFGQFADYSLPEDRVEITGQPGWVVQDKEGSARKLVIGLKSQEFFALDDVRVTLPPGSLGDAGLNPSRTNTAAQTETTISSRIFTRSGPNTVFSDNVLVQDGNGAIHCQVLHLQTGSSNEVQTIVAEGKVLIDQKNMDATGDLATYNVTTGFVHLTGEPRLVSADRVIESSAFWIDRRRNTFSVAPGQWNVKIIPQKKPKPVRVSR